MHGRKTRVRVRVRATRLPTNPSDDESAQEISQETSQETCLKKAYYYIIDHSDLFLEALDITIAAGSEYFIEPNNAFIKYSLGFAGIIGFTAPEIYSTWKILNALNQPHTPSTLKRLPLLALAIPSIIFLASIFMGLDDNTENTVAAACTLLPFLINLALKKAIQCTYKPTHYKNVTHTLNTETLTKSDHLARSISPIVSSLVISQIDLPTSLWQRLLFTTPIIPAILRIFSWKRRAYPEHTAPIEFSCMIGVAFTLCSFGHAYTLFNSSTDPAYEWFGKMSFTLLSLLIVIFGFVQDQCCTDHTLRHSTPIRDFSSSKAQTPNTAQEKFNPQTKLLTRLSTSTSLKNNTSSLNNRISAKQRKVEGIDMRIFHEATEHKPPHTISRQTRTAVSEVLKTQNLNRLPGSPLQQL